MHTDAKDPTTAIADPPPADRTCPQRPVRYLLAALAVAGARGSRAAARSPKMTTVEPSHADKVVVKKSQRKLELHNNGRVIREYRIALGGSPDGHKFREGDQRTPIGDYSAQLAQPEQQLLQIDPHLLPERARQARQPHARLFEPGRDDHDSRASELRPIRGAAPTIRQPRLDPRLHRRSEPRDRRDLERWCATVRRSRFCLVGARAVCDVFGWDRPRQVDDRWSWARFNMHL
jgi:hypothetical protein